MQVIGSNLSMSGKEDALSLADKRKKVIESDQTSLLINQDPKEVSGSSAPA